MTDLLTITSGGQTGADQGALEAAYEAGAEIKGWCPKGRKTEKGPVPEHFPLKETGSAEYPPRTRKNVIESNGTLICTYGVHTPGTRMTARFCKEVNRPCLEIDIGRMPIDEIVYEVKAWGAENYISNLNVAGPRESKAVGTQGTVKAIVARILAEVPPTANPNDKREYTLINSAELLNWAHSSLDALPDQHLLGYDHEGTGLYPILDWLVGTSISWDDYQSIYLPYDHTDKDTWGFTQDDVKDFHRKLQRFRIVSHKAVFDSAFTMTTLGIDLQIFDDTRLLCHLLELPIDLERASMQVLGEGKTDKFSTLMSRVLGSDWKKKGLTASDMSSGDMAPYAFGDSDICRRLYYSLKPQILERKLGGLHMIEANCLAHVKTANLTGSPVDVERARFLSHLLTAQIAERQAELDEMAGRHVLATSTKQVVEYLFTDLDLPVHKRSPKTQAPSTDQESLEAIKDKHPAVPIIQAIKSERTLNSNYLKKIEKMVDPNNRVYTEFKSYGADTGRFTSSGMDCHLGIKMGFNMQSVAKTGITLTVPGQRWNLEKVDQEALVKLIKDSEAADNSPIFWKALVDIGAEPLLPEAKGGTAIPTHWDLDIRSMFGPAALLDDDPNDPMVWVKADLSQIEARLSVNLAGETYLIDKFKAGADMHKATAALFLGIKDEEVTKAMRDIGKAVNFATAYGGGPGLIAQMVGISVEDAKAGMVRYWANLDRLKAFNDETREFALKYGCTRTFFGRQRTLYTQARDKDFRESELRKAVNTKVQGSAAEFLKIGLLRTMYLLRDYIAAGDVQFMLQVHDELDFLVRESVLQEVCALIKQGMEVPVPEEWCRLKVDIGYGPSWSESSHTEFQPPEDYVPEKFVSWKDVMPPDLINTRMV